MSSQSVAPGSRRWTPRSALARAREVARADGLRAVWFRALGETVYRRLDVFEYPLPPASPRPPSSGAEFRFLTSVDADAYAALHDQDRTSELAARLGRGERCFGVWRDGALVGARWLAPRQAWIEYLARTESLGEGDLYVYELYTAPDARGQNLVREASWASAHACAAEGARRFVATISPENHAALRTAEKAHWTRIGRVGYVKLGPWRRTFGSLRRRGVTPR